MGRRTLRRPIWGYAVCLCPTKRTPGLNELNKLANPQESLQVFSDLMVVYFSIRAIPVEHRYPGKTAL